VADFLGGDPTDWDVVVALPAHDEECLAEFLAEIDSHLTGTVRSLRFVVVDDASPEPVDRTSLPAGTRLLVNRTNLGHGPTVLRAYREALSLAPDVVVHVDGDGQFRGHDFPRLLQALVEADVVLGTRVGRDDPWFRRVLSRLLRQLLPAADRVGADVNTPLRAYRATALPLLLDRVPADSLVPHVHWSLLHGRLGLRLAAVPVESLPRRGASSVGTTWRSGRAPSVLPPRRLLSFCRRALLEVVRVRSGVQAPRAVVTVVDDAAA